MVDIENASAATTATATETVGSSSRAASETTSAAFTATTGEGVGADKVRSTRSVLPTAAETDADTTATSTVTGSAITTAASDNGVARFSCNKGLGLTWTVVMIGLCLLVAQVDDRVPGAD